MSLGLIKIGPQSPPAKLVGTPTAVQLSANGVRAFYRSQAVNSYNVYGQTVYNGAISVVDWDGEGWSAVSGLGGQTGGGEIYNEGAGLLQISANGQSVAWDFRYFTPATYNYRGIHADGQNPVIYYSFAASNPSTPSSQNSPEITTAANSPDLYNEYSPRSIRFSDDASLRFVYYQGGNNLIEINAGIPNTRPSLFFPFGGTYGNDLKTFQISGDGNHVFVFVGGSIKLFSWDGSAYNFAYDFSSSSSSTSFSVNFDGSIIAIQNAGVKIYEKTGSTWAQLGAVLTDGSPRLNSSGTLVTINHISSRALYLWDGTAWGFVIFAPASHLWSGNPISDNGEAAIAPASAGSIQRYEIEDVPPLYRGSSIASAIYAGSTPATAVYYGPQLLWNVPGWEPPAPTPASIAGLRLWLDASEGLYDAATGGNAVTTDTAPVLRWEDRSGNGFHATAVSSTAPTLSLNQVNSLPAIALSGSQQMLLPTYLDGTAATVFVVVNPSTISTDNGPLLGNIGSDNSSSHYPYRGGAIYDKTASTSRKDAITQPAGFFSWHLYNVISATGSWKYLFNGTEAFSTTSNTYAGAYFTTPPSIGLDQAGGTYRFRGSIAEIVVYNTALSETERFTVSEYLRAKYSLY